VSRCRTFCKNFNFFNETGKCFGLPISFVGRGKVKTKHDITWFAQKTNVDQLNHHRLYICRVVESSLRIYDSGGVYAIECVRVMF
jgi:hypothetical protein